MTNIVIRPVSDRWVIMDRDTGQVLDPREPEVQLAGLEAARREIARLSEFRRALSDQLVEYTTKVGERTTVLPDGTKIVREGGPVTEYDDPAGMERELLAAGCPAARVSTIVVTTIDKKVSGVEARKAAAANPEYARIIDRHARKVDKPYSIKLG